MMELEWEEKEGKYDSRWEEKESWCNFIDEILVGLNRW